MHRNISRAAAGTALILVAPALVRAGDYEAYGKVAQSMEYGHARPKRKHADKPTKKTNRANISARVRRKHRRS